MGETPNLAARLQGLAGPDEVVIAPATRRLVGDAFELSDLGRAFAQGHRASRCERGEWMRCAEPRAASRQPTAGLR